MALIKLYRGAGIHTGETGYPTSITDYTLPTSIPNGTPWVNTNVGQLWVDAACINPFLYAGSNPLSKFSIDATNKDVRLDILSNASDNSLHYDTVGKGLYCKDTNTTYTIVKTINTGDDYFATYKLIDSNGNVSGDLINIPKDFLVQSGQLVKLTTVGGDTPTYTFSPTTSTAGETYSSSTDYLHPTPLPTTSGVTTWLDFVINVKSEGDDTDPTPSQHIWINVADLVNVYTASNKLTMNSNVITHDTTTLTTGNNTTASNQVLTANSGYYLSSLTTDNYGHVLKMSASSLPTIPNNYSIVKVGATTIGPNTTASTLTLSRTNGISLTTGSDSIIIGNTSSLILTNSSTGTTNTTSNISNGNVFLNYIKDTSIDNSINLVGGDKINVIVNSTEPKKIKVNHNTITTEYSGNPGVITSITTDGYGHITGYTQDAASTGNVTSTLITADSAESITQATSTNNTNTYLTLVEGTTPNYAHKFEGSNGITVSTSDGAYVWDGATAISTAITSSAIIITQLNVGNNAAKIETTQGGSTAIVADSTIFKYRSDTTESNYDTTSTMIEYQTGSTNTHTIYSKITCIDGGTFTS